MHIVCFIHKYNLQNDAHNDKELKILRVICHAKHVTVVSVLWSYG
jgi:hypothetical protein